MEIQKRFTAFNISNNGHERRPLSTTTSNDRISSNERFKLASTPPPLRKTMGRGAYKSLHMSIRKRGEMLAKIFAKEWMRRTLIRV
ncbi:MAG: hypothetical protein GY696_32025 [Gammaproteobacteria bacterium]|nr:hypothetical protein [Gammaproteobacteria bacterium]